MDNLPKNFFKNCQSLTSITLPNTTLSIGDQAFFRCASLKEANIGTGVKFIGLSAFANNAQLTSIDRLNDNDGSHTFDIVCDYAFAGTGLKKAKLSLRSSSIYTFWGDGCFQGCKDLIEVNVLSANYLSKDMFKDCTSLVKITFDKNFMAYTYPSVFQGCTSLRSITLPSQLIFLTEGMFKDCINLLSVNFNSLDKSSNITEVQREVFSGCDALRYIELPASIKESSQIHRLAFSGLGTKNHDLSIAVPGLATSDIGCPLFNYDIYYGEVAMLDTAEDVDALLSYSATLSKPIAIYVNYAFSFMDENEEVHTVWLKDVAKSYWTKTLPYKSSHEYFNATLASTSTPYEFGESFTYLSHKCDFTNKPIIVGRIDVNIGMAQQGQTLVKLLDLYDENLANYPDDYNAFKHLTNRCQLSRFNHCVGVLFFYTAINKNTLRCKLKVIKGDRMELQATIDKNLNFIYKSICNNVFRYHDSLDDESIKSIGDMIKDPLPTRTKIDSPYTVTTIDTDNTGFFDAYPYVGSNIYFKQYKTLFITSSPRYSRGQYVVKMNYTNFCNKYIEPTTYESDKDTTSGFTVGKWYYNAKQLHQHARNANMPCLFIYSLLGCGPCAIYQKNIWNNEGFQSWSAKQNFYLCGMEVQKQPLFDEQLAYCVDQLSPYASNFAKLDMGEHVEDKTPNGFGDVFYRSKSADGSTSSNLMTPVLIFMDKSGNSTVYTYHNIYAQISTWGVDGVINCLKSLCLKHFDGNDASSQTYVKDWNIPFNMSDYPDPVPKNDYKVADKTYDFGFKTPAEFMKAIAAIQSSQFGFIYSNPIAEEAYKTTYGDEYTSFPYLGDCWFSDIIYLQGIFPDKIENSTTAHEMNSFTGGYKFIFNGQKYALSFNDNYMIYDGSPCTTPGTVSIALFIPIWTKIS